VFDTPTMPNLANCFPEAMIVFFVIIGSLPVKENDSFRDRLDHEIDLFITHARIYTDPKSIVHDRVSIRKLSDRTISFMRFAHLVKTRVLHDVSGK
jgi:hypothetical protein